jgi:hypothetical protein
MTDKLPAPAWLFAAAAVVVLESVGQFMFSGVTVLGVVTLGASILVACFLLRGSRVAWVVAVFSAAAQLAAPAAVSQPLWFGAAGVVLLVCVLVPPSRRYVWSEKPRQGRTGRQAAGQPAYARVIDSAYGLAGRLPGMGAALEDEAAAKSPSPRRLILLLAVWVLVFLPLVGALNNLRHGSGRGNEVVDVLWHVFWIVWNLVLFALVGLLVVAHLNTKKKRATES